MGLKARQPLSSRVELRCFLCQTQNVLHTVALLQVFRPQNPWTMAIMNVLAELHQEHDLKVRKRL